MVRLLAWPLAFLAASQLAATAAQRIFQVSSQHELTQLIKQTQGHVPGDLYVSADFTPTETLHLDGLIDVQGDLVLSNLLDLKLISSETLQKITGSFQLMNLHSLTTMEFPLLRHVGTINWQILPILNFLQLYAEQDNGTIVDRDLIISDTSLTQLDEYFTNIRCLNKLNINNNRFLESATFSNLVQVKDKLNVQGNSQDFSLKCTELQSVDGLTVRDAAVIELPKLQKVYHSMEIIENPHLKELKLPELQSVDGTLGIMDNALLSEIDLQSLQEIQGGFMFEDNFHMDEALDFVPSLKVIGGAVSFNGPFADFMFHSLKLVKGSVSIKSTSDQFSCQKWIANIQSSGKSIIRGGQILCEGGIKSGPGGSASTTLPSTSKFNKNHNKVDSEHSIVYFEGSAAKTMKTGIHLMLTSFTVVLSLTLTL